MEIVNFVKKLFGFKEEKKGMLKKTKKDVKKSDSKNKKMKVLAKKNSKKSKELLKKTKGSSVKNGRKKTVKKK